MSALQSAISAGDQPAVSAVTGFDLQELAVTVMFVSDEQASTLKHLGLGARPAGSREFRRPLDGGHDLSRRPGAAEHGREMPFYFDHEILVRREDLESRLRPTDARPANDLGGWKIQSIRAITVGELRAKGEQATRDGVLGNLSMTDSDCQVSVVMAMPGSSGRTEGAAFFVRKIGGVMKMVGLWD
jgi:hypothetical protein